VSQVRRLGFRAVGDDALLVEVGDAESAQAAYRLVRRLSASDRVGGGLAPPRDVVPGARTVLLDGIDDPTAWQEALAAHPLTVHDAGRSGDFGSRPEVVVVTRYDGQDLDVVASAWKCDTDEVVRRHVATRFTVAFCGFAPGFAYCTSAPPTPSVPRRDEPRPSVPAGSVALAGEYCGIYPRAMPGGWQLIGTTNALLFDLDRDEPALLTPGDHVRFEVAR